MKERMTIAEVSQLVGLAPETIRYYERNGIIRPFRNEQTGYRYYTLRDICILGKAQSYLQCGYSLKEAREMIFEMAADDIDDQFDAHAVILEKQILENVKQLQGLRKKQKKMNQVRRNLNRFSIQTRPAMLLLETYKNNIFMKDQGLEAVHSEWFKHQIFTFPYIRWEDQGRTQGGKHQITQFVGLGIEKDDFPESGLIMNDSVREYSEIPCVYTALAVGKYDEQMQEDIMYRIDCFLEENDLKQTDDIIFETVFLSAVENEVQYYRNVWIPYTKKT